MASYKLIYFDAKGRAETIRLLFHAAGQKFEDFRIPMSKDKAEWHKIKPNMPFRQLPVLEVTENGKTTLLAQSHAISRYLAQKFGLAGKSPLETALVDMYVDQLADVAHEKAKGMFEPDADKKKQHAEHFEKEVLPKNLQLFEEHLAKNNTGFFVGNSLTLADIALFNVLDSCHEQSAALLASYPHVQKLKDTVQKHPAISKYLETRPKTLF